MNPTPLLPEEPTDWTLVAGAADGNLEAREVFCRRYLPVVRAALAARWRGGVLSREVDDAVQDVFLDCFRSAGALGRAQAGGDAGFRGFLHGVVRMVARKVEERRGWSRIGPEPSSWGAAEVDDSPSRAFDRAFAVATMRAARELQTTRAADAGARRRVELLRLRFEDGLPIRAIAALWDRPASELHREYARAKEEFVAALRAVVTEQNPSHAERVDEEVAALVALLG